MSEATLEYRGPELKTKPRVWPVAVIMTAQLLFLYFLPTAIFLFFLQFSYPYRVAIFRLISQADISNCVDAAAYLVCLLMVLLPVYWSRQPMIRRLHLEEPHATSLQLIVMLLGAIGLSDLIMLALNIYGQHSQRLEHLTTDVQQQAPASLITLLLSLGIWGPLVEEVIYRGYAQRRLVERFGPVVGILIASALFAVSHQELAHAEFTFALGIYLGCIAYRTGSIGPSILAHMAVNTVSVFRTAADLYPTTKLGFAVLTVAEGVAIAAAVIILLRLSRVDQRAGCNDERQSSIDG